MNKIYPSLQAALSGIADGASIMIGGFGDAGTPFGLIDALAELGTTNLTIISNNAGTGEEGIAKLIKLGRVSRIVCSFPRQPNATAFDERYLAGELKLDLVPQGNLAERIRAAGAGIGAFFTPTAYGTPLAEGKETRKINGRDYVLEYPIFADYALIKAFKGDAHGNLVYHETARNFGPVMATAAKCTIAQVNEAVPVGAIDPEVVVTPGIFVKRVIEVRPHQGRA